MGSAATLVFLPDQWIGGLAPNSAHAAPPDARLVLPKPSAAALADTANFANRLFTSSAPDSIGETSGGLPWLTQGKG